MVNPPAIWLIEVEPRKLSAMHRGGHVAANKAVEPVTVTAIDAELPCIDGAGSALGRLRRT